MLKANLTFLAVALATAGHPQKPAKIKTGPWPRAVATPLISFEADYSISVDGKVTNFAPSIVSKVPKPVGIKGKSESEATGLLYVSPSRCWTREKNKSLPWDPVSVTTKNGDAVGGHDAEFQVDTDSKMRIEPTGFLDPPGTMALFVGEGLGWSKVSLDGSPAVRTWERLLNGFKADPVRKDGDEAVYSGRSPSGWAVEIRTDRSGARLHSFELRNKSWLNVSRRVVFRDWKTLGKTVLPTKGELFYAFSSEPKGEPTETTHTRFELSNLRLVQKTQDPPWINHMQFRTMVIRHDRPGKLETSSFRLEGSELIPMPDSGNVFKEEGGDPAWTPHAVGAGLVALAVGAVALSRRTRKT